MKPTFIPTVATFLVGAFSAFAETPINELLRDALYAEEVTRDAEAAAKQYDEVISRYTTQRAFAATALFRLAEVRRKQGRKDEAIQLYQRLITEFPESETQVNLAKENISALGGKMPEAASVAEVDRESKELARIRELEKTSPDLAGDDGIFERAIEEGYLRVLTHLLQKGGDPNKLIEGGKSTLLGTAAYYGNLAACELLIKAGATANSPAGHQPLIRAVEQNHLAIADLLMKHGANVNYLPSVNPDQWPFGKSPLIVAVESRSTKMVERLLAGGADANLATRTTNISPLHRAVFHGNEEIVRMLMAAGADPDAATSATGVDGGVEVKAGETPLLISVKSPAILRILLPKSKKADLPSLLEKAIDANSIESASLILDSATDKALLLKSGSMPALIRATHVSSLEMVRLLLKAGADPNVSLADGEFEMDPLRAAVERSDQAISIIHALIGAGATVTPDDKWFWTAFTGDISYKSDERADTSKIRSLVVETFIIPELAKKPSLTLLFKMGVKFGTRELSADVGNNTASLPELLLKNDEANKWPVPSQGAFPTKLTIWRKTDSGKAAIAWTGSLLQKEDFPAPQSGDVIQLEPAEPNQRTSPLSFVDNLPDAVRWNLRRWISFPIKVEVAGETIDYTVRGDRLVYDPTKRELPLVSPDTLARLLWPAEISRTDQSNTSVVTSLTSRDGWPDMKIENLRSGDLVKVVLPGRKPQEELLLRKSRITLKASGLQGTRHWKMAPGLPENYAPTLVQALADAFSFSPLYESQAPSQENALVPWYDQWLRQDAIAMIWNDPDFSSIKIRRLGNDDAERTITVDLAAIAAIIAASDAATSSDEAKNADVVLLPGDIVELKLRADHGTTIWRGLTDQESAFFAKALAGTVQFRDQNGDVAIRELAFSPLRFIDTEAGKLPAKRPDAPGYSSMTIRSLFSDSGFILRNGGRFDDSEIPFLRNGDQVLLGSILGPRRQMQQMQQQQRPQIVSPQPVPTPLPQIIPAPGR